MATRSDAVSPGKGLSRHCVCPLVHLPTSPSALIQRTIALHLPGFLVLRLQHGAGSVREGQEGLGVPSLLFGWHLWPWLRLPGAPAPPCTAYLLTAGSGPRARPRAPPCAPPAWRCAWLGRGGYKRLLFNPLALLLPPSPVRPTMPITRRGFLAGTGTTPG